MQTRTHWGRNNKSPATCAAPAFVVGGLARSRAYGGRIYRVLAVLGNPQRPYALHLQNLGTTQAPAKRSRAKYAVYGDYYGAYYPQPFVGPHPPGIVASTPGWYEPCTAGPAAPAWLLA